VVDFIISGNLIFDYHKFIFGVILKYSTTFLKGEQNEGPFFPFVLSSHFEYVSITAGTNRLVQPDQRYFPYVKFSTF